MILCPECHVPLLEQDRSAHMIALHGYLTVSGTSLPLANAVTCLWDRVFSTGDRESHERLCRLLAVPSDGKQERTPYAAALQEALSTRLKSQSFASKRRFKRLVQNLRAVSPPHQELWLLVKARDTHIRRLGRELLLPEAAAAMGGPQVAGAEIRVLVDRLCQLDDVWEKVQTCKRLPNHGALRLACEECLRELRAERPVACPECGTAVPGSQLDVHLRQAHHIYEFRGVRRSQHETTAVLLAATCAPIPDYEAWDSLETLAQDEYGPQVNNFLAVRVSQELAMLRDPHRSKAENAVAELMASSTSGTALTLLLAGSDEAISHHLALKVATRLPPPLPAELVIALQRHLTRKRAPKEIQISAAAALLRTTGPEGPAAAGVVGALISRCSRSRALERLRLLEEQTGSCAALREQFAAIENQMEMICPNCQVCLKRPEMARHLFLEHQLILDGQHVHTPWRAIKNWIKAYRRGGNAELLVRCRMLGQHLDPDQGLERVNRLILAYRVDDVEARQMGAARARNAGASLCPRCYALVPVEPEQAVAPLNESHGRLSARGFSVEVSEHGLMPELSIDMPDAVIFRGREPGRWLTRQSAILILAGLPVLAGLCLAVSFAFLDVDVLWPVAFTVALGFFNYLVVRLLWRFERKPLERAVDFAWMSLAPHLHAKGFWSDDAAFLASLALSSRERGRPSLRARSLQRILRVTDDAVNHRECPTACLIPLLQLQANDTAVVGEDPVPALAAQIGRCFAGSRPLSLAQSLLRELESGWRTEENLARLRVLLCDKAFESGLEVSDLLAAGRLAPALGELLQTDCPQGLAELRVLWSLRPRRPWDRWGNAITIFDVAADPGLAEKWFTSCPDLLLIDERSPQVVLCSRGLAFKNILFTSAPGVVEARARREDVGTRYELFIDDRRFAFASDATSLVQRLRNWFHHFFNEFQPQTRDAMAWKAPGEPKTMHLADPIPCPECRRLLLPQIGEVGVRVRNGRDEE
jgi:hypothetical protein